MTTTRIGLVSRGLFAVAAAVLALAAPGRAQQEQLSPLQQLLADFTAPPAWVDEVEVNYNTNKPWDEARRDIRPMITRGGESARRGMKLTWLYWQKGDIGDGSAYAYNMFFGGDPLWAAANFREMIRARLAAGNTRGMAGMVIDYSSCCNSFEDYQLALLCLTRAREYLPDPPGDGPTLARLEETLGDTYALMGDAPTAIEHFSKSASIYRALTQNWIRQHLDGHLGRLQDKIDRVSRETPELGELTDGVFTATVWGFEDDVTATVTVAGGAVTGIEIAHKESWPQNAPVVIPEQIIAKQSLDVDAVTGATYTSHAVINAIFRALRQAGLR